MSGEPPGNSVLVASETSSASSNETSLALYRSMIRIREFELNARRLFLQGTDGVRGAMHDGVGQEAVSAGVIEALRPNDAVVGSHRGHAQLVAKGSPVEALFAEILGRSTGLCGGKGGSMHLTDVKNGHYGCSGIVGGQLPIAAGLALAAKLLDTNGVVVAFFGEGAAGIGSFHETLNLAAIWELPVLFICENNQYIEYGPAAPLQSTPHPAADRAPGYGLPRILVDGNDVEAVHAEAIVRVDQMRQGRGPFMIEAMTYRINGHGLMDPAKYRSRAEVDSWREKDPILRQRQVLDSRDVDAAVIDRMELQVKDEFEGALARAKEGPHAGAEHVLEDLWADGGSTWRS